MGCLYNLIEYSDNYSDTTASLYQYKRPEQTKDDDSDIIDIANTSSSFKYKSSLIKGQRLNPKSVDQNVDPDAANAHRLWKNFKIAVPLVYLSNFFRALQLPLINTKIYAELNWTKHSVISNVDTATTFQITKTELPVPVVTLNRASNKKLSELLRKGFKKLVFWNEYKSKIETVITCSANHNIGPKRILLDSSYSGVNRLFVMDFDNGTIKRNNAEVESHRRYLLRRVNIKDYNILIYGRNFYDQNISDNITRYNELIKLTAGKAEDYSTGCLIDYDFYVNEWKVMAADLSK